MHLRLPYLWSPGISVLVMTQMLPSPNLKSGNCPNPKNSEFSELFYIFLTISVLEISGNPSCRCKIRVHFWMWKDENWQHDVKQNSFLQNFKTHLIVAKKSKSYLTPFCLLSYICFCASTKAIIVNVKWIFAWSSGG